MMTLYNFFVGALTLLCMAFIIEAAVNTLEWLWERGVDIWRRLKTS